MSKCSKTECFLKAVLAMQSLAPLYVLVSILHLDFSHFSSDSAKGCLGLAINVYGIALLLIAVLSVGAVQFIKNDQKYYNTLPQTVSSVELRNESNMSFFLTYLVPLLPITEGSWNGLIASLLILVFTTYLVYQAELFERNPVLLLFGYNTYRVKIDTVDRTVMIRGTLTDNDRIACHRIGGEVYFGNKQ